jgi:hypothetical protein
MPPERWKYANDFRDFYGNVAAFTVRWVDDETDTDLVKRSYCGRCVACKPTRILDDRTAYALAGNILPIDSIIL